MALTLTIAYLVRVNYSHAQLCEPTRVLSNINKVQALEIDAQQAIERVCVVMIKMTISGSREDRGSRHVSWKMYLSSDDRDAPEGPQLAGISRRISPRLQVEGGP